MEFLAHFAQGIIMLTKTMKLLLRKEKSQN